MKASPAARTISATSRGGRLIYFSPGGASFMGSESRGLAMARFITRMPERAVNKAVSRKTVLNVLGTLSTILTTAHNWGYTCEQITSKNFACRRAE
jgi:hypothetical protein